MALKALQLRKRIDLKKKERAALTASMEAMDEREKQLAEAIDEAETEQDMQDVEAEVEQLNQDKEKAAADAAALDQAINELETELAAEEAAQTTEPPAGAAPTGEERSKPTMNTPETRSQFFGMTYQERDAFVAREDVKDFLGTVRGAMSQKRAIANVGLTIPEVMLELIRHEVAHQSKLLPFVRLRNVRGQARQNIIGDVPEAIWMEACGSLNELDLTFAQVELDGYQIGGYIPVCNATLMDSDVALATEILTALSGAIAKGVDKGILFGTGTKMPIGIVTRLAQTSQPANWDTNGPAWTDLHTSNIQKINIDGSTGAAFFSSLIEKLAIAKPWYNNEGLFWVMNRKTHLHIMAKALQFNSAAALVSNTDLFPIIGGTVIEFEDDEISDNEIIGGFGGNYLMAEREGASFESSDQVFWLKNQTAFKGWARYDGKPLAGEAFVVVNFANTDPTTTKTFPEDYANTAMNDLIVTAAASASNTGKTVLTVSGTVAQSDPDLQYKLGDYSFNTGDTAPSGFADLTSGTTEITAAAGKNITVIELDANDRIVSVGHVKSVPKTA